MIRYSCIISILLPLCNLIGGCKFTDRVSLSSPLDQSESILCENRPNYMILEQKSQSLSFIIHLVRTNNEGNLASIEVNERHGFGKSDGATKKLGGKFKEDSKFSFQGTSWKILKMGLDGVELDGKEICRYGFLQIKQIP
jgi:hypothetical protein